ncbi:hypothetical protein G5S_0046 [Chlamydia pecorum E58]|uniref:Secreted protein n=1 Tax=Chlamydia pecorum (strain ATCC VR-628 / DSM 29919 / E58) TaxID=331635 RepID=A0AA34RCH6_CHLPE|nr:hypothetical protein G5S_0046 [Chlamydia pecorum E58]
MFFVANKAFLSITLYFLFSSLAQDSPWQSSKYKTFFSIHYDFTSSSKTFGAFCLYVLSKFSSAKNEGNRTANALCSRGRSFGGRGAGSFVNG